MNQSTLSLLLLLLLVVLMIVTVRSQDVIRLPSDDLCTGSAPPPSCPVNCFTTDPVCGVDGVTYWCGCGDALCAGTQVAKMGFCEVGNGNNASLSAQALLLVHILWLIVLAFSVLFGLF